MARVIKTVVLPDGALTQKRNAPENQSGARITNSKKLK